METLKNIKNENCPSGILEGLNELRLTNSLCDVTLEVESQVFPAHRIVLISACKYFKNMLKGKYLESQTEMIKMNELNSNAFKIILNYIYTGVLSITSDNAGEVLKLSDFLQLKWAKNECSKFLIDSLNSINAVEMWEYARECFCDDLQYEANEFILINLKTILHTEKFKKLELEKLEEILQHDKMLSTPADEVFASVIEWMKHDLPNRKLNFNELSKYIKTESVSKDFLKSDVSRESFLREEKSITDWMLDSFCFSREIENTNIDKEIKDPFDRNIFISALFSESNCYEYDTALNEFSPLKKPSSIEFYYPVHYKQNIYLTCGQLNQCFPQVCPKYNIQTKTWSDIKLQSDRTFHGSCIFHDKMYIVGGCGAKNEIRNDLKMYDFESGHLISLASLRSTIHLNRVLFGIRAQSGSLYICGGGDWHNEFNSVERYDPREGRWTLIPDMEDLRGHCTAAFLSDGLYCSARNNNIVKKFDVRLNSWQKISNLPFGGDTDNCLVESGGELYAVKRDIILKFNNNENNWRPICSQSIFTLCPRVIAAPF